MKFDERRSLLCEGSKNEQRGIEHLAKLWTSGQNFFP